MNSHAPHEKSEDFHLSDGNWLQIATSPGSKFKNKLKKEKSGVGGGGGGVGGGFIFLTVSVTFVRQDSTAFIRFGE
jgi:hypothetical protein